MSEIASVGGFVKQYSIVVDPRRLQALSIPLSKIRDVIRESNMDVGGRTVEISETEFAIRGRGYIKSLSDLEQIVVKNDRGVPVLLKDVARVELTPDERRGVLAQREGEVVSGIAPSGSVSSAIGDWRMKDRLAEIIPSLPPGVRVDLSTIAHLINRAIDIEADALAAGCSARLYSLSYCARSLSHHYPAAGVQFFTPCGCWG